MPSRPSGQSKSGSYHSSYCRLQRTCVVKWGHLDIYVPNIFIPSKLMWIHISACTHGVYIYAVVYAQLLNTRRHDDSRSPTLGWLPVASKMERQLRDDCRSLLGSVPLRGRLQFSDDCKVCGHGKHIKHSPGCFLIINSSKQLFHTSSAPHISSYATHSTQHAVLL